MSKYILDSTVLLYAPHALKVFDEHEIYIPMSVLHEMAKIAQNGGPRQRDALAFGRMADAIMNSPGKMFELDGGGVLYATGRNDESIFDVAASMEDAVIVSRSPMVRVLARANKIQAEPFKYERSELSEHPYTGRCSLYISGDEMAEFAKAGNLTLDPKKYYTATDEHGDTVSDAYTPSANEYLILTSMENPSHTMLGRHVRDGRIVPLLPVAQTGPVYGVKPRNVGQKFALDALLNPAIPLVILRGPAGTAKSYLSMAAGLSQVMVNGQQSYKKVLITRPNTKMDNDIGYLKGDETDKTMPILRGLLDNIDNLVESDSNEERADGKPGESPAMHLVDMGVLEMQSMAYMRGRSIVGQYIIVDEMQNSTPTQALSIVTRVGEDTKIVVCGDVEQIDAPFLDEHSNGLAFVSERMKDSPLCAQITFTEKESTRSPLAQEAIRLMGMTRVD